MNYRALQNYVMNASKRFADREVAKMHINEAYLAACLAARCNRQTAVVTLPASTTGDYDVAADLGLSDVAALRFLTWVGSDGVSPLPLTSTTPDAILNMRLQLPSAAWVRTYAYDPPSTLMLYPSGGSGDQLALYYLARPPELDLDEDVPDALPAEFHRVIAWGAIAEASIEDARVAASWSARYEQGIRQLRAWASMSDTALAQTMATAVSPPPFHDRSTDTGG